jgi:hypothetical protein
MHQAIATHVKSYFCLTATSNMTNLFKSEAKGKCDVRSSLKSTFTITFSKFRSI